MVTVRTPSITSSHKHLLEHNFRHKLLQKRRRSNEKISNLDLEGYTEEAGRKEVPLLLLLKLLARQCGDPSHLRRRVEENQGLALEK